MDLLEKHFPKFFQIQVLPEEQFVEKETCYSLSITQLQQHTAKQTMVRSSQQQGVYVTEMGNGSTVYEFHVQETSNLLLTKKKRKPREAKKLKHKMIAHLTEQMLEYLKQSQNSAPNTVVAPTVRSSITLQDLLNAKNM